MSSSNSRSDATINSASRTDGASWDEGVNHYITAKAHANLAVGDVVAITAGVAGPLTAAVSTLAAPGQEIAVVCDVIASGAFGRMQTRGFAEAAVEGTTDVAAGDFLKVTNTLNEFVKDGAAKTVNSSAVAIDAQAANNNVVVSVYLLGTPAVIA